MACRASPDGNWAAHFALEQLQPPQTPQCTGTELELKQFRFAYPHGSSILHIQDCTIPAGRIVGIIGNNGLASPPFHGASVAESDAAR